MADPVARPTPSANDAYPPTAAGLDPVTLPPDLDADVTGAATFEDMVAPRNLAPQDGVEARDEFYYSKPATGSFRQNHFGRFTWAMIVVAGIVLGASLAMMAAGA